MRIRSALAIVLAVSATTTATACSSWRHQDGPAPQVLAGQHGEVRVTRHDHAVYRLRDATVVGDSIVGTSGSPGERVAIAVADVERIDARKVSAVKTGAATIGVLAVVSVIAVAAAVAAFLGDWN